MKGRVPSSGHPVPATSGADRVVGLYQRHGLAWAADRRDRLTEGGWLDRLLAPAPEGARILDLGCGSGRPIARALIERGCQVTGVDTAPDLIDLCGAAFPDHDWRVADMRGLDLGCVFDGVIAWDSFFHLDHDAQRAMFAVFRRHAAPSAGLMFTSGPEHGIAMGEYGGEPLFHASLDPTEYRALLARHGFAVEAYAPDDPESSRTVWLARRV